MEVGSSDTGSGSEVSPVFIITDPDRIPERTAPAWVTLPVVTLPVPTVQDMP
jgi:hypothetical protein